ncbi:MAG: Gfo/Idh/MocA family oxidoreductase [Azospirillaceae bacterium]
MSDAPPPRFAVIGINHNHIEGMVRCLAEAGGTLAAWYAAEDDLATDFAGRHGAETRVTDVRAIYEDPAIDVVLSAAIPNARAGIAVEAMRHGKHAFVDKPGVTSATDLDRLRRVQRETGRRFVVFFTERYEVRAMQRAGDLVRAGAIGRVFHTIGLGPHRLGVVPRPAWFFERRCHGGILVDLASHQMEHFLHFTGSTTAQVAAAQVGNRAHPQYPELEDIGEAMVTGDRGSGYCRVDWFTPDGLPHWGDGRLTLLGTEGTIEIRKNVDPGGQPGGDHLILVDRKGVRRIDCRDEPLRFGPDLVLDLATGRETAQSQAQCFLACQLALEAQAKAATLPPLSADHHA